MHNSELRVQASLWRHRRGRTAVLMMEGRAGEEPVADGLFRVALARGLRLTTDLDHRDRRPVRGWRLRVDQDLAITLDWPRFWPLLDRVPLDLPSGWLRAATGAGQVDLFIGCGIGLFEPVPGGHVPSRLDRVARAGAIAAGGLTLVSTADPEGLDIPVQRGQTERADSVLSAV